MFRLFNTENRYHFNGRSYTASEMEKKVEQVYIPAEKQYYVLPEQEKSRMKVEDYYKCLLFAHAATGQLDCIKYLIKTRKELSAETQDEEGNTLLMTAAENGHEKLVTWLIEQKSVSLDTSNDEGKTAIDLAGEKQHQAIVDLLEKHSRPSCLISLCCSID